MNPLSSVLNAVRLSNGVFIDAQFTGSWAVESNIKPSDHLFPLKPDRLLAFHIVREGKVTISIEGEKPVEAERDQFVMLPRNQPHRL